MTQLPTNRSTSNTTAEHVADHNIVHATHNKLDSASVFNVLEYGAVGDGVADDTVAVQDALDACVAAGGGTVYLPAGNYKVTGTSIALGTTSVRIVGDGSHRSKVTNTAASGTTGDCCFYVDGTNGGGLAYPGPIAANYIEISDLELIGNATCGPGVYLYGCFQGLLSNLFAHGFTAPAQAGIGIRLDESIEIVVVNPIITGCDYGLWISQPGAGCGNINNVIGGWITECLSFGLAIGGSAPEGNNFYGTVFQQNAIGASLETAVGTNLYGCWFEANDSHALQMAGPGTLVDACIFAANVGQDIRILSGAANTIVRKPVFNTDPPKITVSAGSTHTVIEHAPVLLELGDITDGTSGAELLLRDNAGINPVGVVTVNVPASTVAVPAKPYDRTFYVTAGSSTCTMAIEDGPSPVIPSAGFGTIHVPAGKTVTPTFANAPTWVVEGL